MSDGSGISDQQVRIKLIQLRPPIRIVGNACMCCVLMTSYGMRTMRACGRLPLYTLQICQILTSSNLNIGKRSNGSPRGKQALCRCFGDRNLRIVWESGIGKGGIGPSITSLTTKHNASVDRCITPIRAEAWLSKTLEKQRFY
ncbi:hypothetical protein SFRURICE_020492 [Spodoptera frugiperda]|nr:hypothetical protein SFRURICE_020492 [Spodoptera frugiperda]